MTLPTADENLYNGLVHSDRIVRLRKHFTETGACAKRNLAKATPLERWYPYYAGYPVSFARSLLEVGGFGSDDLLLDPWNGSGTSTAAASSLSIPSVGIDHNPVAALVANARLANFSDADSAFGLVKDAINRARSTITESRGPRNRILEEWLSPGAARYASNLLNAILTLLATRQDGSRTDPLTSPPPPLAAFLVLALTRTIRAVSPPKESTNPTWTTPVHPRAIRRTHIDAELRRQVSRMAADLKESVAFRPLALPDIRIGDSRSLALSKSSVSVILTSPPYLTRIDYAMSTRPELALLQQSNHCDFLALRRSMMGTPLTRSAEAHPPRKEWGANVRSLLDRIRSHPSADSHSYYYKQFWQYFDDAEKSMHALSNALRPKGIAVLVAQTSYYKNIRVDLPGLLSSLAQSANMRTAARFDSPVSRVLSSINSRAFVHLQNRSYLESTLLLEKEGEQ